MINLLKQSLSLNDKILAKERECKDIEATIEINRISEDKDVYEVALENELDILECIQKRQGLNIDNILNDFKEVSATAETLKQRIIELDTQIEYLMHRYKSLTLAPKVEYTVKETIEDRVTFRKVLQRFDSSVDKNANAGNFLN